MSRRLAVLLAAGVAAFGCAAAAAADSPTPLSPDDASALVATAGTGALSVPSAVDATTVLAATTLPGADTEVEGDLTLDQAAGVTSIDSATSSTAATTPATMFPRLAPRPMCWADKGWWGWGTWPYEQQITDTTYWCAVYGSRITLRTSSVTAGGTLCGVSWRANQLIGGGVGFPNFTMRSAAGFSCPTVIPWITLHPTHHLDILRDDRGGATFVGTG